MVHSEQNILLKPIKRIPARFYRTPNGREPVREWLKELGADDRKIIGEDIKDVEFAWPLGMPLVRSLSNGLWEVRSNLTGKKDCAGDLLRDRPANDPPAWICQEDTEDDDARYQFGHEEDAGRRGLKKQNIGSSFDDFLKEEGIFEEVTAGALKRVLARQIEQAMREKQLSKTEMARRMKTSRAALDRLLDPENDSITLQTLSRAAIAVGRHLHLELV